MYAYVIQDKINPDDLSVYGKAPTPRTVLVLERDLQRLLTSFPFDKIIHDSCQGVLANPFGPTFFWALAGESIALPTPYPHYLNPEDYAALLKKGEINPDDLRSWGLEIPPPVVKHYNLRMGDKVEVKVEVEDGLVYIVSVNGLSDWSFIRNRPFLDERPPRTSYPTEILPLDKVPLYFKGSDGKERRSIALRMLYLLAPLGKGSVCYLSGRGGLGKTFIMRDTWKALLSLTLSDPKLYLLLVFIGERAEDLDAYLGDMAVTGHDPSRVEVLYATKNTLPLFQWQMAEFAFHRANVLALQCDLVELVDSASRMVDAYRAVADPSEGLVSGGIPVGAITTVARMVGMGGSFPDLGASKTILSSVLDGDPRGDPLAIFAQLTVENNTTAKWVLTDAVTAPFPRISVVPGQTVTRWPQLFCLPGLLHEQQEVFERFFKGPKGELLPPQIVHSSLLQYCEGNPDPDY